MLSGPRLMAKRVIIAVAMPKILGQTVHVPAKNAEGINPSA